MDGMKYSEGYNTHFIYFDQIRYYQLKKKQLCCMDLQPRKQCTFILIDSHFYEYAGFVVQGFENFQVYVS
jgi:hypothetical protein